MYPQGMKRLAEKIARVLNFDSTVRALLRAYSDEDGSSCAASFSAASCARSSSRLRSNVMRNHNQALDHRCSENIDTVSAKYVDETRPRNPATESHQL
ncbi:hypothetical protein PHSY_000380 [Pseudozyma hubeiensis SY62]|uniref:Uncharacterized protein n=1 Tax=Pseudozyma hubeiensis (strain SY62) TaxID=1305764 RepID=R9NWE3_PSEHS|nr:hypothetical protein PHSY_000380 [Pseudozyma hubeiensis SY62]GAC92824.1 hypothetical protein PHSY_000380 [Pseudozyma hubeiensis SY62]